MSFVFLEVYMSSASKLLQIILDIKQILRSTTCYYQRIGPCIYYLGLFGELPKPPPPKVRQPPQVRRA
jgi:hypothetical protein